MKKNIKKDPTIISSESPIENYLDQNLLRQKKKKRCIRQTTFAWLLKFKPIRVGLTSVGCLVLALTLQAKPARAAPSPQATTATQASYSNPGASGVCAQTASIETQSAFNKSGLICERTTFQNSALQVSSKRGTFKRLHLTSSAGFVKRTKKSPIVSRQLSVVPFRSFASSFNEHSLMQRDPLFSLAVPYKRVSKQRIRPKRRLRLQSLRKKKAQRFKGARAGVEPISTVVTIVKEGMEISKILSEKEEKKLKMSTEYKAETRSEDIKMRVIDQRYNKAATVLKEKMIKDPTQQLPILMYLWSILFNYPDAQNLTLSESLRSHLMDEMTSVELLPTWLLPTSDDKTNAGEWRAKTEQRWFSLLPDYENFPDEKKHVAICFFHARQKVSEIHTKRHIVELGALKCDFSKYPNPRTLAVFQYGPLHYQKVYNSINELFIMSWNCLIDNDLDDTVLLNTNHSRNDMIRTSMLFKDVGKRRMGKFREKAFAKKAALASIERLKGIGLIKGFDQNNDGQATYFEVLNDLGSVPTAPFYDAIEKDDFDFES